MSAAALECFEEHLSESEGLHRWVDKVVVVQDCFYNIVAAGF